MSLIRKVEQEINVSFSDHDLIKCLLDINLLCEEGSKSSNIVYATEIPDYEYIKATDEQWNKFQSNLNSVDWLECAGGNLDVRGKLRLLLQKLEEIVKVGLNLGNQKQKRREIEYLRI